MRTELVSTEALAEAFTEQSCNGLVKYYAVEQEERLCISKHLVCVLLVAMYLQHIALGTTLRT